MRADDPDVIGKVVEVGSVSGGSCNTWNMNHQPKEPPRSCVSVFVGQAGKVAEVLLRKAERLRAHPDQPLRLLVSPFRSRDSSWATGITGLPKTDC